MANVQHSAMAGSDLHEPKGVSGASADEVYVANGAGTGTWTATNTIGAFPTNPDYESAETAIIGITQTHTFTHGLGSIPIIVIPILRCKTGESGYVVGDEILFTSAQSGYNNADTGIDQGFAVSVNTTNIKLHHVRLGILALNTDSIVQISPSNWKWVVKAWA